jgi:hypothetical protein
MGEGFLRGVWPVAACYFIKLQLCIIFGWFVNINVIYKKIIRVFFLKLLNISIGYIKFVILARHLLNPLY